MEIWLFGVSLLSLIVAGVLYINTVRVIRQMDAMVEAVIDGTFVETDYTEHMLSRLEAKIYRYLCAGSMANQQIQSERDTIKTLVSDISHQTKTPIANLLLYSQLLCENGGLDEKARNFAEQIEGQAEKLNFLVQSLIKTSRLENGIVEVVPNRNSIQELLGRLDHKAVAQIKGITFRVEEIPDIYAYFDPKWTLEALSNIVDNGVKYTREGGMVTVSARDYEMFVRIDVADTGIGISEEDSAKIFTRFYRSERVRDEKGVGIGLYLAREIIRRESGYIKVRSEVGKGAVFSVFLTKQPILSKL